MRSLTDRAQAAAPRWTVHKRNARTPHVERPSDSFTIGADSFKRLLGRTARIRGSRDVAEIQRLDTLPPSLRCARDDHPRKPKSPSIAETSSKGIRRDLTLEGTDILVRPVCEGNGNAVPSYGDRREHWLRRDALRRLDKCVVPLFQSIVDFGPRNEDRRTSDVPGARASVHVGEEASYVRLL